MDLGRIFANAIARRVATVLVSAVIALVVTLCSSTKAHASVIDNSGDSCVSNTSANQCNQGQAYAQCMGRAVEAHTHMSQQVLDQASPQCVAITGTGGRLGYNARAVCTSGCSFYAYSGHLHSTNFYYPGAKNCAARGQNIGYSFNITKNPDMKVCNDGCEVQGDAGQIDDTWIENGSDPSSVPGNWVHTKASYTGNVCSIPNSDSKPECPAGQTRNDRGYCVEPGNCPLGQSMIGGVCTPDGQCPVGQVRGPDGSCNPEGCGAGRAKGKDGTCKPDTDGDGVADADEDEEGNEDGDKFSGGETCDTPPACSGDAIMCGIAKINWRIDCNTRRDNYIVDKGCAAIPICTGKNCDAMEYAQLLQQWRTACKTSEGGGSNEGIMTPTPSGGVLGDDGYTGATATTTNDGPIEFNEGGYGYGATCPAMPSVTVFGETIDFDTSIFCDWMKLGGVFVMIVAYLGGLAIVIRA